MRDRSRDLQSGEINPPPKQSLSIEGIIRVSEDVTKLPKWAQCRIQVLESDLATAKAKLNDGPDDSRVILDPYSEFAQPVGDPLVQFRYPDGQYIDVGFRDDVLTANAGDMLLVGPSAWNAVRLIPGREIRRISGV